MRNIINFLFRWTHKINEKDWEKINECLVEFAMNRLLVGSQKRLDKYLAQILENGATLSYITSQEQLNTHIPGRMENVAILENDTLSIKKK